MYSTFIRNAPASSPAISIILWVLVLTFITALSNCAAAQHISPQGGEINGQWYRSTVEADTLVLVFNKLGIIRMFFILNEDYEGDLSGLGPKVSSFKYGMEGYILLEDSMCGQEKIGYYHATIKGDWMFLAYLGDRCEERRLFFTGSWHRPVKEIQQPIIISDARRGKQLDRIY